MQNTVVIKCPAKLRSMIAYARANNCEKELGEALLYLLSVVTGSMIESTTDQDPHDINFKFTEKEVGQRVEITSDWAPQSLNFAIFNDKERCIYNGGFIHRGPKQGEVLSTTLTPQTGQYSWEVHT